MILVDTSVWIDHFHKPEPQLVELLNLKLISCHPLVIEEIALGSVKDRDKTLSLLEDLEQFEDITHPRFSQLVTQMRLWGKGLSVVDVHLLGSVIDHDGSRLWTRDQRLHKAASAAGVAFSEATPSQRQQRPS